MHTPALSQRIAWRRLSDLAGDALVVACAASGVAAVAYRLDAGLVLLGVALLGLLLRLYLRVRVLRRTIVGSGLVSRVLLLAGGALATASASPGAGTATWLAAACGLLALVGERYVPAMHRFSPPVVAHLPGVAEPRASRSMGGLIVVASLCVTAVGLLVAGLQVSPWWWALVSLAALAPSLYVFWHFLIKLRTIRRLGRELPEAVAAYAPEFLVYTSWPRGGAFQATMWLPYLERADARYLVVARHRLTAVSLAAATDAPVIEARRIPDLEALLQPSVKAAFYVNASSGNGELVRNPSLTHVFLGHGDSDKPSSYNPSHAMYDRIFAAGPAAARRYAAHGVLIPEHKFQIVGRPQVEAIEQARVPISEVTEPVVLYAPTWRGHVEEARLSSLHLGEQVVARLLARGATVIFRPHPFSYHYPEDVTTIEAIQRLLAANAAASKRQHLWGEAAERDHGVIDCMNASSAMICDVSSVVSDYLFSGKPLGMVAVSGPPQVFATEYPVARATYLIHADLSDLDRQLARMLGEDPLAGQRRAVRNDYLGNFPVEGYASAFVHAVRDVLAAGKPKPGASQEASSASETAPGSSSSSGPTASDPYGRRAARSTALRFVDLPFGLLTLALAAGGAQPAMVTGSALIAVALAFRSSWPKIAAVRSWSDLLTTGDATRALLLAALAVLAWRSAAPFPPICISLAIIAVAVAGERHIRAAWGDFGLRVHDLPTAAPAAMPELVPRGALPLVSTATLAVAFAVVHLNSGATVLLAASALLSALFLEVTVRAMRRAVRVVTAEAGLYDALVAYAPAFAVYFGSTVGAGYQVGMWLPYFLRIGRPFVLITRDIRMFHQLVELTAEQGVSVPIVHRRTLASLDKAVVPSLRAAFYVNNATRNTHFIERRSLVHVWLNHGDSEKPSSYNPVHAIYDLIFVAGQAGIDRYARHGSNIPPAKFRIVGRPQVEAVSRATTSIRDLDSPTVLYAPTWQGPYADTRFYSLPIGREIVAGLLQRGARVIFRAHPFNYRYKPCVAMIREIGELLAADRTTTGQNHLWGPAAEQAMSIVDCFNASDAMVADVSAVVSDYLQSEKPLAIVAMGQTPDQLAQTVPAVKAAYVLREDMTNLDEVYTKLLSSDPLADVRRRTRTYYLADFDPATYAEAFLTAAREVVDAGAAARPATPLPQLASTGAFPARVPVNEIS